MTVLTIDEQLDQFEVLQAAATARRTAQAEAADAARYAAEQAAKVASAAEIKVALRACLDEYCELVRTLDVSPLNPDAWRQVHLLAVKGNKLIWRLTGMMGYQFQSPSGGGFVETVFKRWGLECSHSANREQYNANIKLLSESLRVDRVRADVQHVLNS